MGTGSMVIHVPLGAASSEITLENVLVMILPPFFHFFSLT